MSQKTLSDKVADRVAGFGALLALFGVISSALYLFDYNLRILAWVDLWGQGIGWAIRACVIVGGGVLFVVAKKFDKTDTPEAHAAAAQTERDAWEAVKQHPRTRQFLADLGQQMQISWDEPTDPDTYRIRLLVWQDAKFRSIDPSTESHYGPDDPAVTNAAVYLERASAPKRLYVHQDFATRKVTQQEAPASTWSVMVGS